MVGRLDWSDSSMEVCRGSEAELNSSITSTSTFESLGSPRRVHFSKRESYREDAFVVEQPPTDDDDDYYYEEPDTPLPLPHLRPDS